MKKHQAKPGSVLRRIAIVGGLCLLVQPRPGIVHVVGLVVFLLWLLHQADCCWKCVFCSLGRDFAGWGLKFYRRERRKQSPRFYRLHGFAYSLVCRQLHEQFKKAFRFHRASERLLRRTISIHVNGYSAESNRPPVFEGLPPCKQEIFLRRVTYKTPPEGTA